jgi:hypothetical protein
MDPNDTIDTLSRQVDWVEINPSAQGFTEIRRALTHLRQEIDHYVQGEVLKALQGEEKPSRLVHERVA